MKKIVLLTIVLVAIATLISCAAVTAKPPENPPSDGPVQDITSIVTAINSTVSQILFQITGLILDVNTLQTTMDDNFTDVDTSLEGIQNDLDTLLHRSEGEPYKYMYVTGSHKMVQFSQFVTDCYNQGETTAQVQHTTINSSTGDIIDEYVVNILPFRSNRYGELWVYLGFDYYSRQTRTDSSSVVCWTEFRHTTGDISTWYRYMPNDFASFVYSDGEWVKF